MLRPLLISLALVASQTAGATPVVPGGPAAVESAPASEFEPSPALIETYIEDSNAAILDGRMVQASELLSWLNIHGDAAHREEIALLRAEHYAAQGREAEAAVAMSLIQNVSLYPCRQASVNAWIANQNNDVNSAILLLFDLTGRCPSDAGGWNLLGLAFLQKSEFEAARQAFDIALSILPDNAEIINNKALSFAREGSYEVAASLLDAARLRAPANEVIAANADYANAMIGKSPERLSYDGDQQWAVRLLNAGSGAEKSGRSELATALFARAVMLWEHYDKDVWSAAGGSDKGSVQN